MGFVRRVGATLVADGRPYRFRGLNYYDINTYAGENPYRPGTRMVHGCRFHSQFPIVADSLARMGPNVNALRGWFFQPFATAVPLDGGPAQRDWSYFDHTLAAVRQAGMRIVVTIGDQYGCGVDLQRNLTIGWYRSGYRTTVAPDEIQTYRDYLRDIVTRYRDHPEVLAWQLVSEATVVGDDETTCDEPAAAKALRSFADDTSALVHRLDPNHLVSLGTGRSGCGYIGRDYAAVFASPGVDLCEYHDYYDPALPVPPILRSGLDTCGRVLHKPLFIGETGMTALDAKKQCPARFRVCRAGLLRAKFAAQATAASRGLAEDVAGQLVWDWCEPAWTKCAPKEFDIMPGDPTLGALAALPVS